MDITDLGNYLSEIKEVIQEAISTAEAKEGDIEYKVESLVRAKDELEEARGEVEEVYHVLVDFDGERLANAIDEANNWAG
jgi:hypothetical protein